MRTKEFPLNLATCRSLISLGWCALSVAAKGFEVSVGVRKLKIGCVDNSNLSCKREERR